MGLEELVGRLERDADARVAEIEARAQAEIDAIEATAATTSVRARDEALAARRAERAAKRERAVAEARHAARAVCLRAEHALLERALQETLLRLDAMDRDEEMTRSLPERVRQALLFVEGRTARVRCRPALAPAIRGAVVDLPGVSIEEVASMAAGFKVVTMDGAVEIDDTLPSRLQRQRPRLLMELLAQVDQ